MTDEKKLRDKLEKLYSEKYDLTNQIINHLSAKKGLDSQIVDLLVENKKYATENLLQKRIDCVKGIKNAEIKRYEIKAEIEEILKELNKC